MKNREIKVPRSTRRIRLGACAAALGTVFTCVLLAGAGASTAGPPSAYGERSFVAPIVFQAAGPKIGSIQATVDAFRAQLGDPNNGNQPGPLTVGRREINWDGGGSTATSLGPTPFTVFSNTRGALMRTPGSGFVQAPLDGLVTTFGNPTYAEIFQTFSPLRLFSPIDSNVTIVDFFVPGSEGSVPATTSAFGLVLTDVDQPDGRTSRLLGSTLLECFDVRGRLLYRGFAPASPGDASLSFLGVAFDEALIARVRIRAGDQQPGGNDGPRRDIVMMDDFLYAEPIPIP